MKLTNKQLRQIIKEELEHVLQEGQRYNGVIEILTGDKESTVYSIEGASGSMGGRQSLTIAAERYYNSSYPEDAENTARQWVDFLNRKRDDVRAYIKEHVRLRRIPRFEFDLDVGEKHRQHMDELFNKEEK